MMEKFEKVSIARSMAATRESTIFLIGSGRITTDVELLLEDKWKKIIHAVDANEAKELSQTQPPMIVLAWYDGQNNLDCFKSLEGDFKFAPKKILVISENDSSAEKAILSRRAAVHDIHLFEIPDEPRQASVLIDELLEGVLDTAATTDVVLTNRIRSAYEGFLIGAAKNGREWQRERSTQLVGVVRFILSKFSVVPNSLAHALLYAEVYDFFMSFKDELKDSQLLADFNWLDYEVRKAEVDVPAIIGLGVSVRDYMRQGGFIPQSKWDEILSASSLGRLAIRKLARSYDDLKASCVNDQTQAANPKSKRQGTA